jgi:hypothetical protein
MLTVPLMRVSAMAMAANKPVIVPLLIDNNIIRCDVNNIITYDVNIANSETLRKIKKNEKRGPTASLTVILGKKNELKIYQLVKTPLLLFYLVTESSSSSNPIICPPLPSKLSRHCSRYCSISLRTSRDLVVAWSAQANRNSRSISSGTTTDMYFISFSSLRWSLDPLLFSYPYCNIKLASRQFACAILYFKQGASPIGQDKGTYL